MATWTRKASHISDPPILAFADNVSTPFSITLPDDNIPLDLEGKRTYPAGLVVSKVGSAYRFLPRATVGAAVTASSTTAVTVSPYQVFAPNDVLRVALPYATVTFAGTYADTETTTITIAGRAIVYTVSGSITLAALATAVAAAINDNDTVNQLVTAIAAGAVVYIFCKDGVTLHTLTAAETAASGTATASSAALVANVSVGTVSTVVQTSGNTGTVTLAAAASVSLPVGAPIGVLVDEVFGILPRSGDLTDMYEESIAPIYEGKIYRSPLPYWDEDLARRLPDLLVRTKF